MAIYDLAIIGSGPGGYVCAIRAGQNGLKTVVIEKDPRVGGTCTLRGCIPTKAVLHSADVYEEAQHGATVGVRASGVELEMEGVRKYKEDVANKSSKGIEFLFRKNKVERIHGHGRLAAPGKVSVTGADGKEQIVEAKHVVIATGSAPRLLPGMTLGPRLMTSDELLENVTVPKRLIVLGETPTVRPAVEMLYVQSLLMAHQPLTTKEWKLMNDGLLALIDASLAARRGGEKTEPAN